MTDPLGQSQVLPYLAGLAKLGYEFTLLSFEKKDRYQKSGELIRAICKEHNIRWEPLFFTSRPPLLSKWYDSWQMKNKVRSLHRRYSFAFTHCRSYVAAAAGLSLFQKAKVPFLFDMRGFWVDERVDNGQWNLKNPLFRLAYKIFKKKEKKYFSQSAHIISLTETGKQELISNYGVLSEKVSVIPCCADLAHFDYSTVQTADQDKMRMETGIGPGDKILTYLGSLGGWYLTQEMLAFFSVLKKKEPAARFLFITHDNKENILAMAATAGIAAKDIVVRPASRKEVPVMLSLSTWSVFFIKDAYSKKASSPTKQGEIMAMGIPVICNDIGDTGRIIEQTGAGIVIRSFDTTSFENAAEAASRLEKMDKAFIRKAAFSYYDLSTGTETYARVYQALTS